MLISQVLRTKSIDNIVSISPDEKISQAAEMLAKNRIGSLLVSKDGKSLVGILSERDIVTALGNSGSGCLDLKVSDLMTKKVKTIPPEATGQDALEIMTEGRFRHMPVMQDGELIGIVSIGDVVNARLQEIEAENSALSDMVSGVM